MSDLAGRPETPPSVTGGAFNPADGPPVADRQTERATGSVCEPADPCPVCPPTDHPEPRVATTTDKPSIAELQRIGWTDGSNMQILLEIAAAALAWRDQRMANLQAALMRTETEIEAEKQDVQRARVRRTAELANALEIALSKVRP